MVANPDRVLIFDTTLRDGEQSPGCSMTQPEKLRVARALAELGVDVIEAGFPAASRGDFESVQAVAREVQGPIICGLARCNPDDIELAARAVAPRAAPAHPRVPRHQRDPPPVQAQHGAGRDPQRSPSTGVRPRARAVRGRGVLPRGRLAHRARVPGAGGRDRRSPPARPPSTSPTPSATRCRMSSPSCSATCARTCAASRASRLSVHCHDDLGMAVANSLTAVVAGARQIECTINGIGERAGNCSLEEVVMALKTRAAFFNVATNIQTNRLYPTSRLVSSITGQPIPRNKAVVGENAFAHESGIHQHGMLKHHSTYEIMRPEDVGLHAQPPGARQALRAPRLPRARARRWASSSMSSSSTASSRTSRRSPTRRRSSSTATSRPWCCGRKARPTDPGP